MKFFSLFILLFGSVLVSFAQADTSLAVDERGKFIYYEVVPSTVAADALKARTLYFLSAKTNRLRFKEAQGDTAITAFGRLIISKTLLVMSHPSGEVTYHFQAEIKPGKYRFWLTDFKFIPYQRDRYGNFVASTTVGIPLENKPGKLNAGEWKEYKSQTAKYAKYLAARFKDHLAAVAPIKPLPIEKKVVKKEW